MNAHTSRTHIAGALVLAVVLAGLTSAGPSTAATAHRAARPSAAQVKTPTKKPKTGKGNRARAVRISKREVKEGKQWRDSVVPAPAVAYPQRVEVVSGASQVTDPDALKAEDGRVTTITAELSGSPVIDLDLGVMAGGYVEMGVTTSSGAIVHLAYSEARSRLTMSGDAGVYPIKDVPIPFLIDTSLGKDDNPTSRWDDVTTTGAWRSPAVRGAQRWVSVRLVGAGTVSIDYVRVRQTHFLPAANSYKGRFHSSDPLVDKTWYASVNTVALDTIPRPDGQLIAVDGAKRDRLLWIGDIVTTNLAALAAFPQGAGIVRRSLQAFSCQQAPSGLMPSNSQIDITCPDVPPAATAAEPTPPLPAYNASWVIALHDYWVRSGDADFARRMLPVARRAMGYFTNNLDANGLYSTPAAAQNWHPFDTAAGVDGHTNALVRRGLVDLAALEKGAGAGPDAARAYRGQADRLAAALNNALWDDSVGAMLGNASNPQRNHTQDAQVESVLSGVLTGARADRALAFVQQRLRTTYGALTGESATDLYQTQYISPFISSSELLARMERRDTAGALDLIRRTWGRMVSVDPFTVVWEKLDTDGDIASYLPAQTNPLIPSNFVRGASSYTHAWSTGPVPALSEYVLGIRAKKAGFKRWIVDPQVGDLRFARGRSWTPRGPVVSRWQRGKSDRSFKLTAGSRKGRGEIFVPTLGKRRVIAMDGVIVWDGTRAVNGSRGRLVNSSVRFRKVRGVHTFAWSARR